MKDRISADWIAVDWGTSSLRAWAMADAGTPLAEAASADGMGKLTPDEFEPALLRLIGSWLPDNSSQPIPVIACGMVGARQGWVEAAYRPVPCPPAGLPFTSPVTADSRMSVQIIPGLSQNPPPDVMRGEETQIAGLLHRYPAFEGVACLPGTHTKWAEIADGAVNSFRTFMTGELFDLLSRQSVLRHGMGGDGWSAGAFADGVEQALGDPAGIAGALFPLRAASLVATQDPVEARARLSGLLIGQELAASRARWQGRPVTIVGGDRIAKAYEAALAIAGCNAGKTDAARITLAGLTAAHRLWQETTRS